jgi:hypothetical protein
VKGDLIGINIFLVAVFGPILGRILKAQQERQGQGEPGPRPVRPPYPGPVAPNAVPELRQRTPRPAPAPSVGEGVSSEWANVTMEEERQRFARESDQFRRENVVRGQAFGMVREEAVGMDLGEALSDQGSVARAIVLAEVLGKPKALRRR